MIRIGKIVATHGLTGSLILTHVLDNSTWLKKGHVLHVEMQKGSFIPHFISQCKAGNKGEYIVNIEDLDKVESAKKLVTKHVYADESLLTGFAKTSPLLWIGFTLTDKHKGKIGQIEDVVQTGSQWLATLTYENTEILIPLVDQTIEDVNIKTKTIKVDLPDGLIEVYLDNSKVKIQK